MAIKILTLCTGNAARSVMLGYMLVTLGERAASWSVRTAGTLVSEGHAMSARTRDALLDIPELRSITPSPRTGATDSTTTM